MCVCVCVSVCVCVCTCHWVCLCVCVQDGAQELPREIHEDALQYLPDLLAWQQSIPLRSVFLSRCVGRLTAVEGGGRGVLATLTLLQNILEIYPATVDPLYEVGGRFLTHDSQTPFTHGLH